MTPDFENLHHTGKNRRDFLKMLAVGTAAATAAPAE